MKNMTRLGFAEQKSKDAHSSLKSEIKTSKEIEQKLSRLRFDITTGKRENQKTHSKQ